MRWIGNDIAEVLVQECVVRLEPELPLLPAPIGGERTSKIPLSESIVLEYLYRSLLRVGIEIVGVVADHAAKLGQHMGRENMLV